jgi:hypothetical protein
VSSLKKTEPLPVDSHLHGSPANGACQRAAASDVGKRKEREHRGSGNWRTERLGVGVCVESKMIGGLLDWEQYGVGRAEGKNDQGCGGEPSCLLADIYRGESTSVCLTSKFAVAGDSNRADVGYFLCCQAQRFTVIRLLPFFCLISFTC